MTAEIREGEFVSIFGESGGGKTTLLRILAGLATADSGRIVMDGETWLAPLAQAFGLVSWRCIPDEASPCGNHRKTFS